MSPITTIDETTAAPCVVAGRGSPSAARLAEHVEATVKRLKAMGIRSGDCVASLLPEGPDERSTRLALAAIRNVRLVSLEPDRQIEEYASLLTRINPKLLLLHPAGYWHPAKQAAQQLEIPVANVLRHFEAGVFTIEAAMGWPPGAANVGTRSTPLVLIAPEMAYRRLAQRLESRSPLIGITPPSLEHLAAPHTIEHVASECVRMLERYRPNGPYAFAGWRSEGLVALEMARILEERGEKVAFVALLDAAELFSAGGMLGRLWRSFGRKAEPSSCEYMADALRRYKPRPWAGKILHVRAGAEKRSGQAWFEWRDIAPQGVASFEAPAEMFAEPNVATVAGILATALGHIPDCDNRRSESRTRNA